MSDTALNRPGIGDCSDLRALGSVVLQAPTSMPWGVRAVVKDPDGRPVEVFVPVPDE